MRYLFGFMCVLALGVMGCSETSGTGGVGGGGVTDCTGVEDFEVCVLPDVDGVCLDGACYVIECDGVGDGTPCWSSFGIGPATSPGICAGDNCWPPCENDDDCSDRNDCTLETCLDNGVCEGGAVQDGTPCAGGTCLAGMCDLAGSVLPCSEQGIRNAIATGGGPYTLDCDGPTTVVTKATIWIENDGVTLDGSGVTLDGNDEHELFRVSSGVTELRRFTLTGGLVYNGATLTIANSTVWTTLNVGVDNDGSLTIVNSTVSGEAGDAQIFNEGSLMLISSTVVADSESAVALDTGPARIDREYLTMLQGTVVEGSCELEQSVTSDGYNIESPGNTCGFDQQGDQANVTEAQLDLQPLAANGGPTMTHALGAGSVAIDKIPADMCEVDEDQRGFPRDLMCDVGAFEVQP